MIAKLRTIADIHLLRGTNYDVLNCGEMARAFSRREVTQAVVDSFPVPCTALSHL